MKPIAICKNDKIWRHKGNWSQKIIEYCIDNHVDYRIVDPYRPEFITELDNYSAIIWFIQNYLWADLLEARNILRIAELKGLRVFPNQNTSWHFDDKIAQMYAFKSCEAPIPTSWAFYLLSDAKQFLSNDASYPLVAKLRCGSGASNVKLLKNKSQALNYARRMFGRGFNPSPSLLYKAYSKAQSSKDWKTMINRIKKIPQFLYTRSRAKQMPQEKGYCYFQSFIENPGYDLKVFVVGDKLAFIGRKTRKYDFRASGGGDLFCGKEYITKQILDDAFATSDKLRLQCMGYDFVVDSNTGKGCIVEMSYGTGIEEDIYNTGGYFTRSGSWIEQPVDLPVELVRNLLK